MPPIIRDKKENKKGEEDKEDKDKGEEELEGELLEGLVEL